MTAKVLFKSIMAMLVLTLSIWSCEDEYDTERDRVSHLLTRATWRVQTVTAENLDKTSDYSTMKLRFSVSDFSASDGGKVWPADGMWTFEPGTSLAMERSDGLVMYIKEISDENLTIDFTWDERLLNYGPGRKKSVPEAYRFTFIH